MFTKAELWPAEECLKWYLATSGFLQPFAHLKTQPVIALLFYRMKNRKENAIFRQSKDFIFLFRVGISNDDIIGTSSIDFTLR